MWFDKPEVRRLCQLERETASVHARQACESVRCMGWVRSMCYRSLSPAYPQRHHQAIPNWLIKPLVFSRVRETYLVFHPTTMKKTITIFATKPCGTSSREAFFVFGLDIALCEDYHQSFNFCVFKICEGAHLCYPLWWSNRKFVLIPYCSNQQM